MPHSVTMGTGERRMRPITDLMCGRHCSSAPNDVAPQSYASMSWASCPPPVRNEWQFEAGLSMRPLELIALHHTQTPGAARGPAREVEYCKYCIGPDTQTKTAGVCGW